MLGLAEIPMKCECERLETVLFEPLPAYSPPLPGDGARERVEPDPRRVVQTVSPDPWTA